MNKECRKRFIDEILSQPLPKGMRLYVHSGLPRKEAISAGFRNSEDKSVGMLLSKLTQSTKAHLGKYLKLDSFNLILIYEGRRAFLHIDLLTTRYFCDGMGKSKVNQLKLKLAKELFQF